MTLDIAGIGRGVLDRSLPKAAWTHEAHCAAALWIARVQPELAEPDAMRAVIMAYNEATGTPNTDHGGYHHTITRAYMVIVQDALAQARDAPLDVVLEAIMSGPYGRPDGLLLHWRKETLFSVAARKGWVAPDLRGLEGV